jgi:hypothetical protein
MPRLIIKHYKPQASSISMYDLNHKEDITTKVTTLIQTKLKNSKKNIPVQPRIHAEAILNLSVLSNETRSSSLLTVAMYMSLLLCKDANPVVEVQQKEIAEQLKLSIPSIIKALTKLESLGYLKSVGKSSYRIAPKLAFYGSNIAWSLSLVYGGLDDKIVLDKIAVIEEQIASTLAVIEEPLINLTNKEI